MEKLPTNVIKLDWEAKKRVNRIENRAIIIKNIYKLSENTLKITIISPSHGLGYGNISSERLIRDTKDIIQWK